METLLFNGKEDQEIGDVIKYIGKIIIQDKTNDNNYRLSKVRNEFNNVTNANCIR